MGTDRPGVLVDAVGEGDHVVTYLGEGDDFVDEAALGAVPGP